jgi:class 3 adenylate cyclase
MHAAQHRCARAGEVVVKDAVATAAPPGLAIAPKGPVALKGMGEPITLFEVRRA